MKGNCDLEYDVVIVGAGPAGCFAARNLSKDLKVLLVDRAKLPRSKSCGGVLLEEVVELLEPYGTPDEIFSSPRNLKVEGWDWDLDLTIEDSSHYINANRDKFDEWLLSLAAQCENVDVWPETSFVSAQTDSKGSVCAVTLRNTQTVEVKTRFLVGADGATSKVRKMLGCRPPERYFTLQELIKPDDPSLVQKFIGIVHKDIDFYTWLVPKDDLLVIGTAFDAGRNDSKSRFEELKRQLETKHGIKGETVEQMRGCALLNLKSKKELCSGAGNVLLVGEAAGMVAPTTGEGISYALRSGLSCAKAISECAGNGRGDKDDLMRLYESRITPLTKRLSQQIFRHKMTERPGWRSLLYRLLPPVKVVNKR